MLRYKLSERVGCFHLPRFAPAQAPPWVSGVTVDEAFLYGSAGQEFCTNSDYVRTKCSSLLELSASAFQ